MPSPATERLVALGAAVRARRIRLGLHQGDLADLAGCSRRFVTALENGKPTVQIDKVLDVLGVIGFDLELVPGRGDGRITVRDPADVAGDRQRVGGHRR